MQQFWSNVHLRSSILFDASGNVGRQYDQPRTGLPFGRQYLIGPDGIIEEAYFFHDPSFTVERIRELIALTEVGEPAAVGAAQVLGVRSVPNPANGGLAIACDLAAPARVTVEVYDAAGRRVRRLATDLPLPAGTTPLAWDGRDDGGNALPSGIYLYRVRGGEAAVNGKVSLVR